LYRNGRFRRRLGVGGHWLPRFLFKAVVIDIRERTVSVPGQEVLTSDNLGIKVSLVLRYTVVDAEKAAHRVQAYEQALYARAQLALRAAMSRVTAEELLEKRLEIGAQLLEPVRAEAGGFGVEVHALEIKDVMLPAELRRAFAEVLRARQEGQAALERTRAETASLRNLANAAKVLEGNPSLLRLRTLGTVESAGKTGTIVLGPGIFDLGDSRSRNGGGD
ncbi:MAG: slipin family protein, partial [Planctomycetota bacterium]